MFTLEEKKAAVKKGKDKLREQLKDRSLEELETFSSILTEKPLEVIIEYPSILPMIQVCIGTVLGELIIEQEETELKEIKE